MTIKQDWEDWRMSRVVTDFAEHNLERFYDNVTEHCSVGQYFENYRKAFSLTDVAKNANNQEYIDKLALECRSSSCFYKVPEPQYKLCKCINVRFDGFVARCCKDCPHFGNIKKFAKLTNQLKEARLQQRQSLNKLLSNLLFWKQKGK